MTFADQLTVARIALAPVVVLLFAVDFPTTTTGDGRLLRRDVDRLVRRPVARRSGQDLVVRLAARPGRRQVLVLATLVVLLDTGVFPAWMVAAIVGRELLISGLRLAALERGVVIPARDLGKLKTWSQAIAAAVGGLAAAGRLVGHRSPGGCCSSRSC